MVILVLALLFGGVLLLDVALDWMVFPWPSARAWRLDRMNTIGEMVFKDKWRRRR